MTLSMLIGIVAGIISFVAYFFYILTTLKGVTKPNKVTWWILTMIGSMIAVSYYASGARETIWIAISYVLGPLIIATLSVKLGEGEKMEFLDKVCLAAALICIFIYYLTSSIFLALLISILLDFIALIPTIKKSYFRPASEDRIAWTLETMACILNIFAINSWTLSIILYPLYLLAINSLVTVLLFRK